MSIQYRFINKLFTVILLSIFLVSAPGIIYAAPSKTKAPVTQTVQQKNKEATSVLDQIKAVEMDPDKVVKNLDGAESNIYKMASKLAYPLLAISIVLGILNFIWGLFHKTVSSIVIIGIGITVFFILHNLPFCIGIVIGITEAIKNLFTVKG